jgi:hypothetical protein
MVRIINRLHSAGSTHPAVSGILLFLCLTAWSFSSPISSGLDSGQHLASVWCANGESAGDCQNIRRENSVLVADIPYINPSAPTNEDGTQTFPITSESEQNLFYKVMHLFVQKDSTQSVLSMRLFNSGIFSIICALLLNIRKTKFRFAALTSLTFTLIPILISTVSQVNPRSWAITSVASSWVFLGVSMEHSERRSKIGYAILYGIAVLLAISSRWDAALFVAFTSLIMIIRHFLVNNALSVRRLALKVGIFAILFLIIRFFSQTLSTRTSFQFFNSYPKDQFIFFQLVHIPENIADGLGLGIRYFDIGPNIIGIIGVSLFAISLAFNLRGASQIPKILSLATFVFIFIIMFRMSAVWNTLTPPVGAYTASLLTFLMGISAIDSNQNTDLYSSRTWRIVFISLLSYSHFLTLYSRLEWSTTSEELSPTIGTYSRIDLQGGWWWSTALPPLFVLMSGSLLFILWLVHSWFRTTLLQSESVTDTRTSVTP